jgi:hypothetical protein
VGNEELLRRDFLFRRPFLKADIVKVTHSLQKSIQHREVTSSPALKELKDGS